MASQKKQTDITYPKCGSEDVISSNKKQLPHTRLFLSYGHDEHATLAEQLKKDLQDQGHEVWFDLDRLKPGGDWETYIEEGLEWVSEVPGEGCFILLMTPHSVRRPNGYCLNEIVRAIERNLTIIPVMVVWSEPPLSICRIQWFDMRDCVPLQDRREQYFAKFERLIEAVELNRIDFEGVHARLKQRLQPLEFDADIIKHLARFTGRKWVFDRIDEWLEDAHQTRVFWITGNPGVGKTAIAVWLFTHRREVAAFHLCQHGHKDKSDPRKTILSIAYQLSSQLPDYQERLNGLNLEEIVTQENAKTLFDNLIVQPLSGNFPHPGRTVIILIDALDEATEGDKNEIATLIASEFDKTPEWVRLIITSRPEPEVTYPLQALTPYILNASNPENEKDLRAFLHRELVPFTDGKEVLSYVIDTIISNSEGIFLYVEWIRRELEEGRLSLDRLDDFPQGLGGIYIQFFERQFPDSTIFKSTYRPVLEIIAAACEPLELDTISSIFNWSVYEHGEVIDALGSLFPVSASGIQPFHKSVLDWLIDRNKAGSYFTMPQEGHKRLADYGWQEYLSGAGCMSRYFIVHLPMHLSKMGRKEDLHRLLLDYNWLKAKLDATDVTSLISDYDHMPDDADLHLVQGALRLSANALAWDRTQVAGQLLGRLQSFQETEIQSMLEQTRKSKSGMWMRPLTASLTPPGGPLIRTLESHTESINIVAVSFNGRHAISASIDGTLIFWDLETGKTLNTLKGHTDRVNAIKFTQNGKYAISASNDETLIVWDLIAGEVMKTLYGHTDIVNTVRITQNGKKAISASRDRTLKVWDLETGNLLKTLKGHTYGINAIDLTEDERHIISASDDKTLKVWNIETGDVLNTLKGHTGLVNQVVLVEDGKYALSASDDKTLRFWDVKNGYLLQTLKGHTHRIFIVAVTQNGKRAISASEDETLNIWDLEKGERLYTLADHEGRINAVALIHNEKRVISASYDGTLKIWDINNGKLLHTLKGHSNGVNAVVVMQEGRCALSASNDKTLKIWDLEIKEKKDTSGRHLEKVNAIKVTPNGKYAISASNDKTLKLWNLKNGKLLHNLKGHTDKVNAVALTHNGKRIVSASNDKTLRIWDIENGRLLHTIEDFDIITTVVVTKDNCAISASSGKYTLRVWDIESGKQLHTLDLGTKFINFLVLTCAKPSYKIPSFNLENGEVLTYGGDVFDDETWAITYNGKSAISSSHFDDDDKIEVWDVESGKTLHILAGHTEKVNALAITDDGKRAVSVSSDKKLNFWDLKNDIVVCFTGDNPIFSCAISPDGLTIIGGDKSGQMHFLRLEGEYDKKEINT